MMSTCTPRCCPAPRSRPKHSGTARWTQEQLGRLSADTVALLVDLGITRLVMPARWHGLELGFRAVVDVVAVLARACMSTAWCAALYAEHPWILAHFDERAQADVWCDGADVLLSMSIAAYGQAVARDDGFALSGTWPFVSGCDHADWFMLACESAALDGSGSQAQLCLVPRRDVSIDHASWQVAGLRGTGSRPSAWMEPSSRATGYATRGC